jgi:hypothetical protein
VPCPGGGSHELSFWLITAKGLGNAKRFEMDYDEWRASGRQQNGPSVVLRVLGSERLAGRRVFELDGVVSAEHAHVVPMLDRKRS